MTTSLAAVVFDLDGTLVDSRADLAASVNYALSTHGFSTHMDETIGGFVGDGAKNLIARAARIAENHPQFAELLSTFLEHYDRHCAVKTQLMPGALEALNQLSDLKLALLTNKPRQPTLHLLAALGQLERFSVIVASGDLPYLKPDPRPLAFIAERLNLPLVRVAMVGDGPQDIECGRRAGATTIGVKGGIASLERLEAARPDYLIDNLLELPRVIRQVGTFQPASFATLTNR